MVLNDHPQGVGPVVHMFLKTLSCAQKNAGQATWQVSQAGKMSISAEMTTLSTKLTAWLVVRNNTTSRAALNFKLFQVKKYPHHLREIINLLGVMIKFNLY